MAAVVTVLPDEVEIELARARYADSLPSCGRERIGCKSGMMSAIASIEAPSRPRIVFVGGMVVVCMSRNCGMGERTRGRCFLLYLSTRAAELFTSGERVDQRG